MKIALFLPNWIGDAVMATPSLRALREHFPDASLLAVVKPYVAGVFDGCPWFDRVLPLDTKGNWRQRGLGVALQLRREQIDLAVLYPNSFRSTLIAWLGGCKRRVGYDRYGRGLLLTDRLRPIRDRQGDLKPSPILDAYNELAMRVGCPKPGNRMELFSTPDAEAAADQVWHRTGLKHAKEVICLNPGAAFGAAKYWPVESFAALAGDLVDRRGSSVLVLCGPNEKRLAQEIVAGARRPSVASLAEFPLSLGLTKACVRRSAMLVTTDSGPRHFALAFGRPVVTLFGPTHIAWTETPHVQAIHLQKQVSCGPCQLRVCPLDHRCMKELSPAEVFDAVTTLLERRRYQPSENAA